MGGEADEIRRPADPAAMRIHARNVPGIGFLAALAARDDFAGLALCQRIAGKAHVADAARLQHRVAHIGSIRLARYLLDDPVQHAIAEIRIGVMRAGRSVSSRLASVQMISWW